MSATASFQVPTWRPQQHCINASYALVSKTGRAPAGAGLPQREKGLDQLDQTVGSGCPAHDVKGMNRSWSAGCGCCTNGAGLPLALLGAWGLSQGALLNGSQCLGSHMCYMPKRTLNDG
eukprot:scaffold228793_cov22-Tisochrysis_lutea.AAC.3